MYVNVTDAFFYSLRWHGQENKRNFETLNNLTLYTFNIHAFISAEISDSKSIHENCWTLFTDKNENFNIKSCLLMKFCQLLLFKNAFLF